jgi:UDP-N-acetylglucosamine:LPS N-acetylglucosamine transferase
MDFVYASADIIISRAGHISSELSIVGKPVILFLLLAEDHQTKNAKAIVDKRSFY